MSGQVVGSIVLWLIVAAIVIAVIVWLLSWLYHRSTKDQSFVRTGFGGEKVVINGGALVLPILHEVTPVLMGVNRYRVVREKDNAIITKDRMRVDIDADFFVRVIPTEEGVSAAAASLGSRQNSEGTLNELMEGKFISALRAVAAEMTLDEMHEKRSKFVEMVAARTEEMLTRNGLELESVAITDLDQTELEFFNPANRFDAEGLTQLITTIEDRRKMRNDVEQASLVEIRARNLEAEKKTLEIERQSASAKMEQEREIEELRAAKDAEIVRARAEREAEAAGARIAAEETTSQREIERRKLVDEAEITAHVEIEQRRIAQEVAVEKARIERERVVKSMRIGEHQATSEAEIASREEIERARIASDRSLEEARILFERDTKRLEVERALAIELAEIEKQVAILKKRAEESAQKTAAATAEAEAAIAAEHVETGRETEIARRIAAVDMLMAEKDADVARIAAETEKVQAVVSAEASRLLNEAENILSTDARDGRLREKVLDRLEGIVRESVKPLENIEGIKIVHMSGFGGEGGGSGRSPTDEVIDSALRFRAQAPLVDEVLKEIGVSNPGVAKMGDIFRSAKDAAALAKENAKEKGD